MPHRTAMLWNIERLDLLAKLTPKELTQLKDNGAMVMLPRQTERYPSEDTTPSIYILMQGYCKFMTTNAEGKRFTMSILKAGDLVGNIIDTDMDTDPDSLDTFLEAVSDCHFLQLESTLFANILAQNPAVHLRVLQHYQGKSRLFQRKLSDLLFKDVHARIAQLFLDVLFDYGDECPYAFGLQHDICLKHHEIAELIGASRPVTSLALGDFQKTDLIHKHDGFICIVDLDALRSAAEHGAKAVRKRFLVSA